MKTLLIRSTHSALNTICLALVNFIFLMNTQTIWSQDLSTSQNFKEYKGSVLDKNTNKPLEFATLTIEGTHASTISNNQGEFSIKVPTSLTNRNLIVQFVGYETTLIPIASLEKDRNKIKLKTSVVALSNVPIAAPKNARNLIERTLANRGESYFTDSKHMTAFYRETVKKRNKNLSLAEAVVSIIKRPNKSASRDEASILKARKSSNYSPKDTLALKLQGGPYNAIYLDVMKYTEYIFGDDYLPLYDFKFQGSTRINNKLIYIVHFEQKPQVKEPLYRGNLYIDAENYVLTNGVFSLNITNPDKAASLFVQKKPKGAVVHPTEVNYKIDYREKDGKWYYGYSNLSMTFKVNWDDKLFNSLYTMSSEMAITDWSDLTDNQKIKNRDKVKTSIILSEEADGFFDPEFWGAYNIIEPDKSIESAIKKIKRQLKRLEKEEQ